MCDLVTSGVGICGITLFFFKQKTAYEMRISDWSSDVCSSDLVAAGLRKVDYDNAWGVAFQAGFDYRLTDRWYFNADVKKILLNTDVTVTTSNGTVIRADTDLDPWVVGVGVGYKF